MDLTIYKDRQGVFHIGFDHTFATETSAFKAVLTAQGLLVRGLELNDAESRREMAGHLRTLAAFARENGEDVIVESLLEHARTCDRIAAGMEASERG